MNDAEIRARQRQALRDADPYALARSERDRQRMTDRTGYPAETSVLRCVSGHVMLVMPNVDPGPAKVGEHAGCDTCDQCGAAVDLYGVRYCQSRGEWTGEQPWECACGAESCATGPYAPLLVFAGLLADRHRARIGFWRERVLDQRDHGLIALCGPEADFGEALERLDNARYVLVGAFGLGRLPADFERWWRHVEALVRMHSDAESAERESGA